MQTIKEKQIVGNLNDEDLRAQFAAAQVHNPSTGYYTDCAAVRELGDELDRRRKLSGKGRRLKEDKPVCATNSVLPAKIQGQGKSHVKP